MSGKRPATKRGVQRAIPKVGGGADPVPGTLIAERYRIESVLGQGGIGKVFLATQLALQRHVALKLLHPELSARPDIVTRFEREARAASRLVHPGSVVVYDFGNWQGQLYIAMEYVVGETIAMVIGRDFPLTTARTVDVGRQLCSVLGAAHDMGLLHRDIKPENVLVTRDRDGREVVKLVDFGLAYLFRDSDEQRLTREGTVSGTPAFMSPEQALDKPLDPRSDLYALGCLLYEMVTRRVPFEGTSTLETLTMQLYEPPVPPSQRVRHEVPKALESAILWTLQKAAKNRPQSAAVLDQALAAALGPPPAPKEALEREARARAANLPVVPAPPRDPLAGDRTPTEGSPTLVVVLVEAPDTDVATSAAMVLRTHGWEPAKQACWTGWDAVPSGAVAIVRDLRADPKAGLAELKTVMASRPKGAPPVIVVGPDDDFELMSGALAAGVVDYVPESIIETIGRKIKRAVERARR